MTFREKLMTFYIFNTKIVNKNYPRRIEANKFLFDIFKKRDNLYVIGFDGPTHYHNYDILIRDWKKLGYKLTIEKMDKLYNYTNLLSCLDFFEMNGIEPPESFFGNKERLYKISDNQNKCYIIHVDEDGKWKKRLNVETHFHKKDFYKESISLIKTQKREERFSQILG